jgi:hypothetical protein
MLKAKQIPDKVVQEFIAALHGKPGLPYREVIAAAINAWPGMEIEMVFMEDQVVLPLPKENTNAES